MSPVSTLNYAYALGRVRARERLLIKTEMLAKAAEADLEEALRLLAETGLTDGELLRIRDSRMLEESLERERLRIKEFTLQMLPDSELHGLLEAEPLKAAGDILRRWKKGFLADFLRQWIDAENIRTFMRLYLLKEPETRVQSALTTGGFIRPEEFAGFYALELPAILHRLEFVQLGDRILDYRGELGEAILKTAQERSFIHLEKAIQDFLIRRLRPARYLTFGPEPVLAFFFAKLNELRLVRLIVIAKLNGVANEQLKPRLNDAYV